MHNPLSPGKNVLTKFSLNNLIHFARKSTVLSLFTIHYFEESVSASLAAAQPSRVILFSYLAALSFSRRSPVLWFVCTVFQMFLGQNAWLRMSKTEQYQTVILNKEEKLC